MNLLKLAKWFSPVIIVLSAVAQQPGSFTPTGSMSMPRYEPVAVPLTNGKVLVAGGTDNQGIPTATAELYDPASGAFSSTGSMISSRVQFAAARLADGRVLVAGGYTYDGGSYLHLSSAEIYDPATGAFTATGSMSTTRTGSPLSATLLPNRKVLIAGGLGPSGRLSSAELFDPSTGTSGTFSATGSMTFARHSHTATLLPNGKVLIAGGEDGYCFLRTAETYDPTAGTFALTGSMATARIGSVATLLNNGQVLIAGGQSGCYGSSNIPISSAELYDPGTETFSPTGSMHSAHGVPAAAQLNDGQVLVAGGNDGSSYTASAELYDPVAGTFSSVGSMSTARYAFTASLLPQGDVLVAGGVTSNAPWTITASAELFVATVFPPPVANAGPDQVVEATSAAGASVTLDGSGSSDPDGDTLTYTWTGPFGTASGVSPTVTMSLGTNTITLSVDDGHGHTATATTNVTVRDTTPPVLALPANFPVNATGPSGAVVTYNASAVDLVDPNPAVSCAPVSGTPFANGTTTVVCTATDFSGNTSAPGSFAVTVNGAAAQIGNLIALVNSVLSVNAQHGIENSLDAKLQNALAAIDSLKGGNVGSAVNQLNAFIKEVQAQSGKAISVAQASQLIAAAQQVKAALGAP